MSDIMRTALEGGGKIHITIDAWPNGNFELAVTEDWNRLTAIERAVIPADRLASSEDPDGMIREELTRLVREAHMNWKADRMMKLERQEKGAKTA